MLTCNNRNCSYFTAECEHSNRSNFSIPKRSGPKIDRFWVDEIPHCLNCENVAEKVNYPDSAIINHIAGKIQIKALVGTDGYAVKTRLLNGPEIFYEEVKKACTELRFSSATFNVKPVKCWVKMVFNFIF